MAQRARSFRAPWASRTKAPRPHRGRRRLLIGAGIVLAALIGVVATMSTQASRANDAIDAASAQANRLQRQITEGDTSGARATLRGLQTSTEQARSSTDGRLWDLAATLPVVGASIEAVQMSSTSLDDIAQRALPPLVNDSRGLDAQVFQPQAGTFDVAALAELADPVTTAADVLAENQRRIAGIDPDDLIGRLKEPVAELTDKLDSASSAATAAARTLRLAPGLLGADGPRTYLLLFQNNAEARPPGGIPGAYAVIRTHDGTVTIGEQGDVNTIGLFDEPVLELTDDELGTFGTTLGTDLRDITLTPDFPRTAQLASAMASARLDLDLDGVFSVDPVAMSYALEGTGPVKLNDNTTLTSDNAVDLLLNTAYATFKDPAAQNAYFAASARRLFDAILSGRGDAATTLAGLSRGARERRILMWSADRTEQSELAGTRVGGTVSVPPAVPKVGIYVSDSTASKMQYYLRTSTTVTADRCTADGVQTLRAAITLRSTAPADAALLPEYITGPGDRTPRGSQRLNMRVFGPSDGMIEQMTIDGTPTSFGIGAALSRPVLVRGVVVGPGESTTIEVTMQTGAGQTGDPVVTTTPGVVPFDQDQAFASACGSAPRPR